MEAFSLCVCGGRGVGVCLEGGRGGMIPGCNPSCILVGRRKKGGRYSLIWPIRGCASKGMVFVLSVSDRVYNFA